MTKKVKKRTSNTKRPEKCPDLQEESEQLKRWRHLNPLTGWLKEVGVTLLGDTVASLTESIFMCASSSKVGLLKIEVHWMMREVFLSFLVLILSTTGQKWCMSFFRVPYFTLQFNLADNDLLSKCKYVEHMLALTHKACSHFSSSFKIALLPYKSCRCKTVCLCNSSNRR